MDGHDKIGKKQRKRKRNDDENEEEGIPLKLM